MPSTYQLKSRFQSLLRPVAARLYRAGVTANQITIASCLISVALGVWALLQPERTAAFLCIAFWCLLRMACNALDGMLAREFGQASALGAVLNEAGDIISDIALYLPFAWVAGSSAAWVIVIVFLAACSELIGWLGAIRQRVRGNHGPMGKSDRALVFGVTALLIGTGVPLAPHLDILWWCVTALLCVTLYNRASHAAARHPGESS